MKNDEAPRHFKRAHRVAKKRVSNPQDAEEYAQDALLATLENPDWNLDYKMRVLDAIRKRHGRPESGKYKSAMAPQSKIDPETLAGKLTDPEEIKNFRACCSTLSGKDRALLFLTYVWGLTGVELADCFGVSKSMISKELKRAHEKISGKLLNR